MTEKIGTIKNPLTIIAIFAGIAEVSGTLVLPFIADENQLLFIYFLIVFPSVLIVVFFLTLNFNNKALYAPSDFKNEENYIKIFKYDESKQAKVEVSVTQDQMLEILNDNLLDFKRDNDIKFLKLERDLIKLKSVKEDDIEVLDRPEYDDFDKYDFITENLVSVLSMPKAENLIRIFNKKGYATELNEPQSLHNTLNSHKAIWLGNQIPFEKAKDIILTAKAFYPHLEYISISDNKRDIPEFVHYQIFIGGSTETALEDGLKSLKAKDWEKIEATTNLEELYSLIGRK